MITVKELTRFYVIRENEGEYCLYNTETGQPESDYMKTVQEVEDWFDQCAPYDVKKGV